MFVLYYKEGCQFSRNAENLLSLYKLSYKKIILNDNSLIKSMLLHKPYYHRTLPAIFYYKNELSKDQLIMAEMSILDNGLFIGGYDKLNNLMSKILSLTANNLRQMYEDYKIVDGRLSYTEFLIIAIYVIKTIKSNKNKCNNLSSS
jgi:hypothetical protein